MNVNQINGVTYLGYRNATTRGINPQRVDIVNFLAHLPPEYSEVSPGLGFTTRLTSDPQRFTFSNNLFLEDVEGSGLVLPAPPTISSRIVYAAINNNGLALLQLGSDTYFTYIGYTGADLVVMVVQPSITYVKRVTGENLIIPQDITCATPTPGANTTDVRFDEPVGYSATALGAAQPLITITTEDLPIGNFYSMTNNTGRWISCGHLPAATLLMRVWAPSL
jgi:hypothetical protein